VRSQPSYEQLATLVVQQAAVIESLQARVASLEAEVVSLRRQVRRDSSNSSQPPSQDGPAAKAERKTRSDDRGTEADGEQDEQPGRSAWRQPRRRQGGQKGHPGKGLARVAVPDRLEQVEPDGCAGCGAGLAGAPGQVAASVQVFDLPAFAVTATEYLMMRRTCAGCGHATTAAPPPQVTGGPACYGPNVVAATTFLASQDVIGIERAADMMSALLGVDVSTGFVSRCLVRLDEALTAAGFEDALKDALRAADVLGTDETPAPLTDAARRGDGGEPAPNPHVYTVRTLCTYTPFGLGGGKPTTPAGQDLVWYGAAGDRTKDSISRFGILDDYRGVLVRDDYGGYVSYDPVLAGVQQCLAHLWRHLDDVHAIDPVAQAWTQQASRALHDANEAVKAARAAGKRELDADRLAGLRHDYDQAVAVGISTNLSRRWHKGNHPGLVLAQRLQRKADQVWLFTTRFDVPATNNGSEHAIRGYKIAAKISGCWRTLATLQRHCRIRSYLVSARNHARRPLDAIRDALTGNPWIPPATSPALRLAA
jgi:transposase